MNSFFEIKEKSFSGQDGKTTLNAQITIDKTHKIFDGHFPNQPVVPGVCMIQMIKEIMENHLNLKLFFSSASNVKFLSVINPEINSTLNAEIIFAIQANSYDVEARLYWDEIIFFKVKGIFSNAL